jgi:hypothetical protein
MKIIHASRPGRQASLATYQKLHGFNDFARRIDEITYIAIYKVTSSNRGCLLIVTGVIYNPVVEIDEGFRIAC